MYGLQSFEVRARMHAVLRSKSDPKALSLIGILHFDAT